MTWIHRWVSVFVVGLLIGMAMQPAVAQYGQDDDHVGDENRDSRQLSAPFRELADLVAQLMATTTDTNDTDSDGLPDSVEWVIGTDHLNNDTDHDRLKDYEEINLTLDPRSMDSNLDGIPDRFEVNDVPLDLDGDGVENAWDWDNDNDGVVDSIDLSPFAKTGTFSDFDISINTSGKPTYVNLQIRTNNPDNLRLIDQVWDWPTDDKGQMQDLDGSTEDVVVSPMLVFESNVALDVLEVADYGMFADGQTAYIPLVPVKDYGNTVAFNARMFIPDQNGSALVSGNMFLQWLVTGYSDTRVRGLEAPDGAYVSVDQTGTVRANGTNLDGSAGMDISKSDDAKLMIKMSNGRYLRVGPGGILEATAIEIDGTCEFTKEDSGNGIVLRSSYNKRYLSIGPADGELIADRTTKAEATVFEETGYWIQPNAITLAVYPEDFMLTGMSVEENHGTDFGAFYSSSVENITAANMLLSYAFLRNATTNVGDMPAYLASEGITCQNRTRTFTHRDLAVVATTGGQLRELIDDLPDDEILPVTHILEHRSKVLELAEIGGGSYSKGRALSVDVAAMEVIASKMLKTNWYNTGNDTWVDLVTVFDEMATYGLSEDSITVLATLSSAWNVGEYTVVRIGDRPVDFELPDLNNWTDAAFNIAVYSLDGIESAMSMVASSQKYGRYIRNFAVINAESQLAKEGIVDLTNKGYRVIDDTLSSIKTLKIAKTVSTVLEWGGYIADIGIAIFTFVSMVIDSGWNAAGVGSALVTSTMLLAYSLGIGWIAGMLAMAGPAGWVFAGTFLLLIAFAELISWLVSDDSLSEYLVNKLVASMSSQVQRSTVSCDVLSEEMIIDDRDNNGLDVGDRVQYNCDIKASVTAKEYAKPGSLRYRGPETHDLEDSYLRITPFVLEDGTLVERGAVSETTTYETISSSRGVRAEKRHTTYEMGPYFEPVAPCINYPFSVVMRFEYNVIYWSCFAFLFWICSRESQSESYDEPWNTFYFDVMPGSIDQFAGWTAITSRDRDGDGLNITEETDSDPMLWDTDGDGLGDRYETVIGTDPSNGDSDGDGLGDRLEIQLGTNAKSKDSDDDGLEDGIEYRGWVVSIDYSGTEFFWHVASDPMLNDTDTDGVSDHLEYWSLLNPMSHDTNGDGGTDRAQDYWISEFAYNSTMDYGTELEGLKIEVHPDGNIFMLYQWMELYPFEIIEQGFVVYNPNGTVNSSWSMPIDMQAVDFDIGSDGDIYVCFALDDYPPETVIRRYSPNGTEAEVYDHGYENLFRFAVDTDNGHFYLGGMEGCSTVFQYDMTGNVLKEFHGVNPICLEFGGDGFLYATHRRAGEYEVAKMDLSGDRTRYFGATGSANGTFNNPRDVSVDSEGFILVADSGNDRVQKFDHLGRYVGRINSTGFGDGLLVDPRSLCVDGSDNILVLEGQSNRIHRFEQSYIKIQVEQDQEFTDTDEDLLPDVFETAGWNITVANLTGNWTYRVTSDPHLYDTDGDGLSDKAEQEQGTDPRMSDTDGDGKSDLEEAGSPGMSLCGVGNDRGIGSRTGTGTDPLNWDSDDDGLGDGVEITFKSDPRNGDTDDDGLLDNDEFGLGADPNSRDTDHDGLDDLAEKEFGSGLLTPDADGDMLFDGMELALGTNPNSNDTDGDGLIEGYEIIHGADPMDSDTDDDGLPDGFEIVNLMNASSNDTDGDNVLDAEELARGLNPLSGDSDGDWIPDEFDGDYSLELDDDVVLVVDSDVPIGDLAAVLSEEVNVVDATPAELLDQHRTAPYIVLVGSPEAESGTAGALIGELLADTGEMYDAMLSGDERMAIRYGVWSPTQTVVMFSTVDEYDALRTLSLLKSMRMTVTSNSIRADYINPRSCFLLDYMETIRTTDSSVWTKLEDMATFDVTITRHDEESTPFALGVVSGLETGELAMGKYLEVGVSDNIWSEGVDLIAGGELTVYYTAADLDRTGDGDADDPEDLDESTLALYWYDEAAGSWSKLSDAMDWVNTTALNTSDFSVYGRDYAGSLWTEVYHLALFSIGGSNSVVPMDVLARAGDDVGALVDEEVTLDGTLSSGNGAILNHTWTFEHDSETVRLHGDVTSFAFTEPGVYTVTLTVIDSLGLTASDTMNVTVEWTLRIGPVKDGKGEALEGVDVNLTVADGTYTDITGPDGVATFQLPPSVVGMDVTVTLGKEGYVSVTHSTRIASDRSLEQAPPAMEREPVTEDDEGIPAWVLGALAIAIILVILFAAIAMRRRPSTDTGDEDEGAEGESDAEDELEEEPEEDPPSDPSLEDAKDVTDDDDEPTG